MITILISIIFTYVSIITYISIILKLSSIIIDLNFNIKFIMCFNLITNLL